MASAVLRRFALPLTVLVSAAVIAVPAPASAATTTTDPAAGAAGWLARQLTDGDHFQTEYDDFIYPDQGLTIDAVLAFVAAGVAGDTITKATTWLTQPEIVSGYIGDGTTGSYAGATAKLAYLALVLGEDPTSFGGVDLLDRLGDRLTATGQYTDLSSFGDFSNTFGQSLAILALARTPGGPPSSAVTFLASAQCADGGFPINFGKCDIDGDGTEDPSDTDGTALAVQALLAAGDTTTAAEGVAWLLTVQDPGTGGISSVVAGFNANSTALGIQVLRLSAKDSEADRALAFLNGLQVGCAGPADHVGAIALTALDPAVPDNGFQLGNARRATAQAVLGLTGIGFADLTLGEDVDPDAPTLTITCTRPVLAVTGTPLTWVVLLGAGLLLVGVALVVLVRVRRRVAL